MCRNWCLYIDMVCILWYYSAGISISLIFLSSFERICVFFFQLFGCCLSFALPVFITHNLNFQFIFRVIDTAERSSTLSSSNWQLNGVHRSIDWTSKRYLFTRFGSFLYRCSAEKHRRETSARNIETKIECAITELLSFVFVRFA